MNNMKNRISAGACRVLSLFLVWSLSVVSFAVAADAASLSPAHPLARHQRVKKHAQASYLEGMEMIDTQTGAVVTSTNETKLFNPASNTKLATTLLVLQKFGPQYRFETEVRTDGTVNAQGVLTGNLFVSGQYMLFGDRQAHELAKLLNDKGIKSVTGNLYVSSVFSMNLQFTGKDGGTKLLAVLDPQHPTAKSRRRKHAAAVMLAGPQVQISGIVKVGNPADGSVLLATHVSPPLRDIVKIMLCYSDNVMAERFGEMIGGTKALNSFVVTTLGVAPQEVKFATTSGLGINRVSPRAMIKIVTALKGELEKNQLRLADLLPVAGIDDGTMSKRLGWSGEAGSVVAKTGTLTDTDKGVSALSGEISTTGNGSYLFVIFEMHGDVNSFRQRQDNLVAQFQKDHGGPQPIVYTPILPRIDGEDFWR